MRIFRFKIALIWALLLATSAWATETRLVVRAKAKDAKFIGTSMGGALVIVRDSDTGEVLAKGLTAGTTGNTNTLMREPLERGKTLADEESAKFETSLDLDEPLFVTIEVSGPQAQRQSRVTSTTQVWLIPGKHLEGDGVIVELPGFSIDVLQPQAHQSFKLENGEAQIPTQLNLVMM